MKDSLKTKMLWQRRWKWNSEHYRREHTEGCYVVQHTSQQPVVLAVRRGEGKTLITSERPAARVLEYGIGQPHKAERPVIEWKLSYILCSWELLHNFSRNPQNRNDQNVNMLVVVSLQLGTPSLL